MLWIGDSRFQGTVSYHFSVHVLFSRFAICIPRGQSGSGGSGGSHPFGEGYAPMPKAAPRVVVSAIKELSPRPSAVAQADAIFATHHAPHCPDHF